MGRSPRIGKLVFGKFRVLSCDPDSAGEFFSDIARELVDMLAEVLPGLLGIKMHLLGHGLQALKAGLITEFFMKSDLHDFPVGIARPVKEMDLQKQPA